MYVHNVRNSASHHIHHTEPRNQVCYLVAFLLLQPLKASGPAGCAYRAHYWLQVISAGYWAQPGQKQASLIRVSIPLSLWPIHLDALCEDEQPREGTSLNQSPSPSSAALELKIASVLD